MEVIVFVDSIGDDQHYIKTSSPNGDAQATTSHNEETNDCSESNLDQLTRNNVDKHSAVWTSSATLTLLKLYESKLVMLETPKRKKMIWLAISESLKTHKINMSPDQVRWKINALTRKYKRCIDSGTHGKFKYYKEMDQVYSKYNIDSYGYTISEILDEKHNASGYVSNENIFKKSESKAIIELRKIRLANRIESDRSQAKIQIERQWLEYLNRQEKMKRRSDEVTDRSLKIKQQELELRKSELEFKQSLELRKIQIEQNQLVEVVQLEKDKCDLLKQIFL